MTPSLRLLPLDQYTVAERLELLERLWDSLLDEGELPPAPEWHAREVARRVARADAEPGRAIPLEQLQRELGQRRDMKAFIRRPRGSVTLRAALAIIVVCAALFAGVGGGTGWALGTYAPGYYRGVFRNGDEPWFDPVGVGVGQGLTQGVAGGVAVGLVVVGLFIWRETRHRAEPRT